LIQWIPELRHHCPRTPILLVGTKADLRKDPETWQRLKVDDMEPVTPTEAEELRQKTRLQCYAECSALTRVSYIIPKLNINGRSYYI
jgi:GTPase SAR1 family protein